MLERKHKMFAVLAVFTVVSLIVPCETYAVPAAPIIHTLKQPNGATFEARQWGDEFLNGWETRDGYTIVLDKDLHSWTYARQGAGGILVSSLRIVGKDRPPRDIRRRLRPSKKAGGPLPLRAAKDVSLSVVPPAGTASIAVLMINFNDTTTTYTPSHFNTLLFANGNYSMKDYYQEVSYGAFSISAGPGGVAGWYPAANSHDYYGYNQGWLRAAMLAKEVVTAADNAGFNFAPYDQDGDCSVEVVDIIHQGGGAESGNDADIWSHSWSLNDAGVGEYTTNDDCIADPARKVKVNDYVMQPETLSGGMQTIGVFAHEYGHALGLPDLYDTDYSSAGVGDWSLMASGSWNYITSYGDRPAHLDAWSKYRLGWVVPTEVTGTLANEPITQASTTADVYKLLSGTPLSGEYFLVENRQKTGFDAGLPGAGLLIWHIDAAQPDNTNECTSFDSCAILHYKVALIEADTRWDLEWYLNLGDTGDPYPGSTGNTSFTNSSTPSSKLYNLSPSTVSITNISASSEIMTATLGFVPVEYRELDDAVDNASLIWTTGGDANWFGQTEVSFSGGDSAQSGVITHIQNSWIQTSVTGPGMLSFYWKVSSDLYFDLLRFSIDQVEQANISGEVPWQQKTYFIPSGNHTVKWAYTKDGILNMGADAGWLDYVVFGPSQRIFTLTSPNGGENWKIGSTYPITWRYANNPGDTVKIELVRESSKISSIIARSAPIGTYGTGSYNWTVTNSQKAGSDYKIRITSTADSTYGDTSDGNFTIIPK